MNILTHYSPTLKELAAYCNFNSINLYAEAFLKTFSVNAHFGNTTHDAVKGLKQVWKAKGLQLNGFNIKDGSGLSPSNGITADNMTEILKAMYAEKSFNAFYESIPIVGISGTVTNLGKKSKAVGHSEPVADHRERGGEEVRTDDDVVISAHHNVRLCLIADGGQVDAESRFAIGSDLADQVNALRNSNLAKSTGGGDEEGRFAFDRTVSRVISKSKSIRPSTITVAVSTRPPDWA